MLEDETSYIIQMEVRKYEIKTQTKPTCEGHRSLMSSLNWIWTHRMRKWSAATCLRLSNEWVKATKAVKFADCTPGVPHRNNI